MKNSYDEFEEEPAYLKNDQLEKIDSSELEEYMIDEKQAALILNILDEIEDEKIKLHKEEQSKRNMRKVTEVAGISIPDSVYAQNEISKYIERYSSSSNSKFFYQILDNGEFYRLYIREELKKRKMPPILEYLPFVESEYKPYAVSKSGAKGLWQFMENSMDPFLKKTKWIDERLDPWLSTKGALTKLQENYNMFGDWAIAIAAYNCGAGAMRKTLSNSKGKSFWYIAENGLLRDESVQYIPKLIAIAELAENGQKYNLKLPETTKSTRYADFDYIKVNFKVDLKWLANEIRLDYKILKELNSSLLTDFTPPDAEYRIRLPSGLAKSARNAFLKFH